MTPSEHSVSCGTGVSKRERVFRAALTLFSTRGFRSTSMAQITTMAGVAEGTVFYHFKNKTELFIAILEDTRQLLVEEFSRLLAPHERDSGLERLERTVATYLALADRHEEHFRLLHHLYAHELAEVNPACREPLRAIYDCLIGFVEEAIRAGIADGTIRPVGVHKAALIVFSMLDGLLRLRSNNLYEPASLYGEVLDLCRRMLANGKRS